eukprot:CAMPEP_0169164306 /NCGR_PEP_ID=MMETSP1015-20121227/58764_1 /TAXON_ID=342587 /ORGANISM="Karlodinium micrum, Strain CCMP2283" /LENGTH=390 /DNA_ID=CAMNT_0009236733 /DNA_START=206 /DNA_END=1378 /DNA_ORIENTATION=-
MARRAQLKRSYTRMVCTLMKGLDSIQSHRGCNLSSTGRVLSETLRNYNEPSPHINAARSTSVCRHWRLNRCYYGESCRFAHGYHGEESSEHEPDDYDISSEQVYYDDGRNRNASSQESTADNREYRDMNADTVASYVSDGLARSDVQVNHVYMTDSCEYDNERPELYHLAACKSTRNKLALFADAAEAFLADAEAENFLGYGDIHHHNFVALDTDHEDVQDIIAILKALPLPDAATHFNNLPTYLQDEVRGHGYQNATHTADCNVHGDSVIEDLDGDTSVSSDLFSPGPSFGIRRNSADSIHDNSGPAAFIGTGDGHTVPSAVTTEISNNTIGRSPNVPPTPPNIIHHVLGVLSHRNMNKKIIRNAVGTRILADAIQQLRLKRNHEVQNM